MERDESATRYFVVERVLFRWVGMQRRRNGCEWRYDVQYRTTLASPGCFRLLVPLAKNSTLLQCDGPTTCIAVGTNLTSNPYVIGTSNNGTTWTAQHVPDNAVDLTGISCSTAEDCVAVGNSGNTAAGSTIMSTISGGSSWTQQVPPDGTSQLKSVACPEHR